MTLSAKRYGILKLSDGSEFKGISFGSKKSVTGEVVFNTGIVGYPESFTDPSYKGQILVLTYPLIGNYGVPKKCDNAAKKCFESGSVQIAGLVVQALSENYSHWNADRSLSCWLEENGVSAIDGIDTRMLTTKLREYGTMSGSITMEGEATAVSRDVENNLVTSVSCKDIIKYGCGRKKVVLVDCGCKNSILDGLTSRNVSVIRVPWNYDFTALDYDGVLISNGPGDPKVCEETINNVRKALNVRKPVFGICLGNQILSLAAGADTYKLKYGHRSQNQPCVETTSKRCFITSQNHGYAVKEAALLPGWKVWFSNANDGTIEGIRHEELPYMSVQFHPEAKPGPTDTKYLFDAFVESL